MDVQIKKLSHSDLANFKILVKMFEDVFEMEDFTIPDDNHLSSLITNPNFIAFVAIYDHQVVGGLTAYVLHQYYSKKPLAYIYDLAVSTQHQRKGIGRQLVAAFNLYCKDQGFEESFVQADKVDDYALDFYRKTKITAEEQVVHFSYTL